MNPAVDPELVETALAWAREAGELTQRYFQNPELAVDRKGDGTPVTIADREAETLLRDRIATTFPEDGIAGEEHGDTEGRSGRRWVIDPIDGTKAFTCGVGLYSNLLYLEDEHGPAVGIINLPALGEWVAAGRGIGCRWNHGTARVSDRDALGGSYVTTSSFSTWGERLLSNALASRLSLRTWGDGYGYALVATGRVEAMIDPVLAWWDVAPMQVIIPEAGGRLTMLDGTEGWSADEAGHGSAVATNGRLHDALIAALHA